MSSGKERLKVAVIKQFANQVAALFTGDLVGNVTGNLTGDSTGLHVGDVTGNVTGDWFLGAIVLPTPTAYTGADAPTKAILPANVWATLTKGSAGEDYTLAAPGSDNVGRSLRVTSTGAYAHVVTVTGLLGGTTMTFAAAAGNGFELFATTASQWVIKSNNGVTQTA